MPAIPNSTGELEEVSDEEYQEWWAAQRKHGGRRLTAEQRAQAEANFLEMMAETGQGVPQVAEPIERPAPGPDPIEVEMLLQGDAEAAERSRSAVSVDSEGMSEYEALAWGALQAKLPEVAQVYATLDMAAAIREQTAKSGEKPSAWKFNHDRQEWDEVELPGA